jgi:hypothetical protein
MTNLGETYSRFRDLESKDSYNYLFSTTSSTGKRIGVLAYKRSSKYTEKVKVLSKVKASDHNMKKAVGILRSVGYPMTKMGLTGIVSGL